MSLENTSTTTAPPATPEDGPGLPRHAFPRYDETRQVWHTATATTSNDNYEMWSHSSTQNYKQETRWVYPKWLNILTVPILLLFPVGVIVALVGYGTAGIAIVGLAFLGVWVFGNLAQRLKRVRTKHISFG